MKDANENLPPPLSALEMRDRWNAVQMHLDDVTVCLERESAFASGRLKL